MKNIKKKKESNKYIKIIDEAVKLPEKQGNGMLKYFVSVDHKGKLARYSLAYINFHISSKDNGRVLGYDNCHGYHHKHYMGKESELKFTSLEEIQLQFKNEWEALHDQVKKQKNH